MLALCSAYCIEGLVQDCSNSIANPLEFLQSCTKPSVLTFIQDQNNSPSCLSVLTAFNGHSSSPIMSYPPGPTPGRPEPPLWVAAVGRSVLAVPHQLHCGRKAPHPRLTPQLLCLAGPRPCRRLLLQQSVCNQAAVSITGHHQGNTRTVAS